MDTIRRRDYCFTLNNPTEADYELVRQLASNSKVRYLIQGIETGASGTPHIQGYVYCHNAVVFSTLQKLLPRAHIEPCKGTPEHNITYCSKTGNFTESGDRPVTQKRKGEHGLDYWETNKKLAIAGHLDDVDPKLFMTHYRTLKSIIADFRPMPADLDSCDNSWYYGDTGTGKSYKARTDNPGHYLKMCNKWWDGYQNEDVVLIEDFDKNHSVLGHHLKIWADRYAFPAEVKGSKVNLRPKSIIVTSNWAPAEIWSDSGTLDPILRRFKVIRFPILDSP